MKTAIYTTTKGGKLEIEYDENAPCRMCGLPVWEASMGGTDVCPWCDCGNYRNGEKFTIQELENLDKLKAKAKKIQEKLINEIEESKES